MMRIGHGVDVHRLVAGRPLILCGVHVPYDKGLQGHSDADVATHALMDALLGAAALGDIGTLFLDTQECYKGADSLLLLAEVIHRLSEMRLRPVNVDVTILMQRPKLRPFIDEMRMKLAEKLHLSVAQVSVKATTTEQLGYEGEGMGVTAHAVCLLESF